MKKTVDVKNKRKNKRKRNAKHGKRTFEKSSLVAEGLRSPRLPPLPPPSRTNVHSTVPSLPQMKNSQNVWIKAYQNIVKWQYQHQLNYWKQCALQLREENARLRRRLAVQDSEDEDEELAAATGREQQQRQLADDHGSAVDDDGEQGEDEALDEEFIAFMEVSARHRLERRRLKNESVH